MTYHDLALNHVESGAEIKLFGNAPTGRLWSRMRATAEVGDRSVTVAGKIDFRATDDVTGKRIVSCHSLHRNIARRSIRKADTQASLYIDASRVRRSELDPRERRPGECWHPEPIAGGDAEQDERGDTVARHHGLRANRPLYMTVPRFLPASSATWTPGLRPHAFLVLISSEPQRV